jgi:nitrile hydratase accessory protein
MRSDIAEMVGVSALPRKNGELVFTEPWESRAFGIAVAASEAGAYDWEEFRHGLIVDIRSWEATHIEDDGWSYYERWLTSLEGLLSEKGIVTPAELHDRMHTLEHEDDHDHDHDHDHDQHHDHAGGHQWP